MARKTKARPPRPGFNEYGFKIKKPSTHTGAPKVAKKKNQAPPATATAPSAPVPKKTSEQDIAKTLTKPKDPPRAAEQKAPPVLGLLSAPSVNKRKRQNPTNDPTSNLTSDQAATRLREVPSNLVSSNATPAALPATHKERPIQTLLSQRLGAAAVDTPAVIKTESSNAPLHSFVNVPNRRPAKKAATAKTKSAPASSSKLSTARPATAGSSSLPLHNTIHPRTPGAAQSFPSQTAFAPTPAYLRQLKDAAAQQSTTLSVHGGLVPSNSRQSSSTTLSFRTRTVEPALPTDIGNHVTQQTPETSKNRTFHEESADTSLTDTPTISFTTTTPKLVKSRKQYDQYSIRVTYRLDRNSTVHPHLCLALPSHRPLNLSTSDTPEPVCSTVTMATVGRGDESSPVGLVTKAAARNPFTQEVNVSGQSVRRTAANSLLTELDASDPFKDSATRFSKRASVNVEDIPVDGFLMDRAS